MNKYDYVLCQIHYPYLHGKTEDSDPNIENHYILIGKFNYKTGYEYTCYEYEYEDDTEDDTFENSIPTINDVIKIYKSYYKNFIKNNHFKPHPTIRNFYNIIFKYNNYIKPEIGQCIVLNTGESICILKTFWIRIIQRVWKKVFKNQKTMILNRIKDAFLYEIGKKKFILPGLKGMLFNI
jgi:hypothetical protein